MQTKEKKPAFSHKKTKQNKKTQQKTETMGQKKEHDSLGSTQWYKIVCMNNQLGKDTAGTDLLHDRRKAFETEARPELRVSTDAHHPLPPSSPGQAHGF